MNSGPVRKTRQIESWSVSHSFMKTHHFDDLDPGDADDISVPQFVSACGQPAPHPVDDVDYDDALGHSHLASHYLARAKDCFENGENKRAGDHLNKAMAHFVQAHSALKAAHCSKCGNFLPASAASHRVAKALIVAKVANQEDDVFGARLAICQAAQLIPTISGGLNTAKFAKTTAARDAERAPRRTFVTSDYIPLAKISKCY
jgi:hypothetical protein